MDDLKPMEHISNMSTGTSFFDQWDSPIRIDVVELNDRIEMIYKQVSNVAYTSYPPPPPEEKVFKIVFSCKDGKWNKSERIYGKIVPAKNESYKF